MKVQELRLLVSVADELHFGRAAERMGMAQPQLSASVRRIEQEAGVTIFFRRPRVELTPAGIEMVDVARRLLGELESGTARARAIASGHIGRASLGFSPPAMCTDLPMLVRRFLAERAEVELKLVEGTTGPLRGLLEQGKLDIIVTREPLWDEGFESILFAVDYMNLLVPVGHALAGQDTVDPATLSEERFMMFSRKSAPHYHARVMRWCRENGLQPKVIREVDSWIAALGLVSAGTGLAFGTDMLARLQFPGVVYRKFSSNSLDVSFWISWNPARVSPTAEGLIQYVRKQNPK